MGELPEIAEFNKDELAEVLDGLGEPKYRAGQLYGWVHRRGAAGFDEMTNIPAALKQRLSGVCRFTVMEPVKVLKSAIDETRKYAFRLYDGNIIEAVFMKYRHGNSVCVSSQVGCRMGCRFCASTLDGCVRNLSAAEMLSEVYRIGKDTGERISNVVIMGSGEPLDNYDEAVRFIRMLNDPDGLNISARNVTLSTCGIVSGIRRLAGEGLPINLALSLHAPDQQKREELMPVAKRYGLNEVLSACAYYYRKTGRRLSFEYSVVKGVNDSDTEAEKLAGLINDFERGLEGSLGAGRRRHGTREGKAGNGTIRRGGREGAVLVNLIPVNPIEEREYLSPDRAAVTGFKNILERHHVNATIRRELGRDISSACGQLRRREILDADSGTD